MENSEENIRPPDEVVRETLIEDNRCDFDKELDEALNISLMESQAINQQYEDKLKKDYFDEINRRTELFKELLFNLKKIIYFDKEVKEIYDILEHILEAYCNQYIESCTFDEVTYNRIFDTLKKIRNNESVLDNLRKIILRE